MQQTTAATPQAPNREPPNFATGGELSDLDRRRLSVLKALPDAQQQQHIGLFHSLARPQKIIDADLQPLGAEPNIAEEIDRLVAAGDVCALAAMYDSYIQISDALCLFSNQPRANGAHDFMRIEAARAMSKAYLIADRMQEMTPSFGQDEDLCRVLFTCALHMGGETTGALSVALTAFSRGTR